MTRERAKYIAPFITAVGEGKSIQYHYKTNFPVAWMTITRENVEDSLWFNENIELRIKPEPREWWITFYRESPSVVRTYEPDKCNNGSETVHVREVMD